MSKTATDQTSEQEPAVIIPGDQTVTIVGLVRPSDGEDYLVRCPFSFQGIASPDVKGLISTLAAFMHEFESPDEELRAFATNTPTGFQYRGLIISWPIRGVIAADHIDPGSVGQTADLPYVIECAGGCLRVVNQPPRELYRLPVGVGAATILLDECLLNFFRGKP